MDDATSKRLAGIVEREHGGILPQFEAFYIHSIIYAADRSESAFQRFDEAALHHRPATLVVTTLQEALTSLCCPVTFLLANEKGWLVRRARQPPARCVRNPRGFPP